MIIAEPIQNAGGCFVPPDGLLAGAARDRRPVRHPAGRRRGHHRLRARRRVVRRRTATAACRTWSRVAKGLTAAYAPMGAVIVAERVAAPLYEADRTLLHGITFAGHPLCAAIALQGIEIFERDGVLENVRALDGAPGGAAARSCASCRSSATCAAPASSGRSRWSRTPTARRSRPRTSGGSCKGFLPGALARGGADRPRRRPRGRGAADRAAAGRRRRGAGRDRRAASRRAGGGRRAHGRRRRRGGAYAGGRLGRGRAGVFWLDRRRRGRRRRWRARSATDLAIVGGGFTGLWAALQAKQDDPARDVVLLEAGRVGGAASGRNGGFVDASLTHGIGNGLQHFPEELDRLQKLGARTSRRSRHARPPCQRRGLGGSGRARWWRRARTSSRGCRRRPRSCARPGRTRSCSSASPARRDRLADLSRPGRCSAPAARSSIRGSWAGVARGRRWRRACASTSARAVDGPAPRPVALSRWRRRPVVCGAAKAVLATSAFRPLVADRALRRAGLGLRPRHRAAGAEQLAALGWRNRHGVSDAGNHFHYYRLTADDRILWGGYDAIYHYGNGIGRGALAAPAVVRAARAALRATFPQLEGSASPTAGAARSTPAPASARCSARRSAGGSPTQSATPGLGVAASRFGARVALDLLGGPDAS